MRRVIQQDILEFSQEGRIEVQFSKRGGNGRLSRLDDQQILRTYGEEILKDSRTVAYLNTPKTQLICLPASPYVPPVSAGFHPPTFNFFHPSTSNFSQPPSRQQRRLSQVLPPSNILPHNRPRTVLPSSANPRSIDSTPPYSALPL